MFYDEDGDLAHEFYEETIVTKNGQKRAKLRRVHKNLIPQVRGPSRDHKAYINMSTEIQIELSGGRAGKNREALSIEAQS